MQRTKFIISGLVVVAMAVVGVRVSNAQTADQNSTIQQLQTQVQQLQQQVSELKNQLRARQSQELGQSEAGDESESVDDTDASTSSDDDNDEEENQNERFGPSDTALESIPAFARQRLQRGERGPAVRQLQKFLAKSSEIYPQGLTTGYYGQLTSQAVKRLKERIGTSSDGSSIGPSTFRQVRTLLEEGAGQSGVIPPGLKQAPGLQRLLEGGLPGEGSNAGPGQFGPPADNGSGNRATSSEGAEDGQEQKEEKEREEQKERNEEAVASGTEAQTGQGPAINIDRLPIPAPQKQQLRGILQQFGGQSEVEFETEDGETETEVKFETESEN